MAKASPRKFSCSKCGRTFAMPAHLARHQSSAHGMGSKKKTRRAKAAKVAARKPAARNVVFATGPQLPLLNQMRTYRNELISQRQAVESQIVAIDRAMAALGASSGTTARRKTAAPRRGGATRAGSLKSHVERVLRGRKKPMAVKDIADAVVRSGFSSKNKTLAKSVGIALTQMPNVEKVTRGIFKLK